MYVHARIPERLDMEVGALQCGQEPLGVVHVHVDAQGVDVLDILVVVQGVEATEKWHREVVFSISKCCGGDLTSCECADVRAWHIYHAWQRGSFEMHCVCIKLRSWRSFSAKCDWLHF